MRMKCGVVRRDGQRCANERPCEYHKQANSSPIPAAVAERDLRETGWWVIERLTSSQQFKSQEGSVVASVLRVLAGLGPSPLSEEEALAEVELWGRLAHGLPPASPEQWERAIRAFEPEAVDEYRRWEADGERLALLLEGDGDDGGEPEVGL